MGPTASSPLDAPPLPPDVRSVREDVIGGVAPITIAVHPGWRSRFPWLVQGITGRKVEADAPGEEDPADFALPGERPGPGTYRRWTSLLDSVGFGRAVLGHQVHGNVVRFHREGASGLEIAPSTDGHVTRGQGVLLAVTVADCVPVTVLDAERKAVAVIHAGWRGIVSGVFEAGLEALEGRLGSRSRDLHVHLGPSICGSCYEVGPEVHEALGLPPIPDRAPVDLRGVLAAKALAAGVPGHHVTVSDWCTLCGGSPFYSHRGGDPWRQVAFAGLKPGG